MSNKIIKKIKEVYNSLVYDDPITCPKCKSEDSETYDDSQNCLDCGYDYNLPKSYYDEIRDQADEVPDYMLKDE